MCVCHKGSAGPLILTLRQREYLKQDDIVMAGLMSGPWLHLQVLIVGEGDQRRHSSQKDRERPY